MAWDCVAAGPTSSLGCAVGSRRPQRVQGAVVAADATPPAALRGAVSGTTVTLTWSAQGTESVLGYIVEAGSSAGLADLASFDTGNALVTLTVTAVPAGTYLVRVRARTAAGVSAASNEIALTVSAGSCTSAPGAPAGLTSSASGSTVILQWTAPSSGCAPTTYVIEVGSASGASDLASIPTGTTATTFSASGVGNGTYYVRVRGGNPAGTGSASNESTLLVGTTPPGGFTIDLPIASGDSTNNAYGIWPFGVHGGGHALDGHPGFDVEYRAGASILVAADGRVQNAMLEAGGTGRYTVRIMHPADGTPSYATDHTNIASLAPGIAPGALVTRGQILGAPGVQSQTIGTTPVTWGMIHFQMNDFSRNEGLTNPNAVSPEPYLSASSRALFDAIWRTAVYQAEWCEPYHTNSRLATYPVTRAWTLQSGSAPAIIEVRCVSATTNEATYSMLNADRSVIESGAFSVDASKKPLATVTFTPASASTRLGVWDILSDTMQLSLGAPGAARPSSLSGAAVYTTR